MHPIDTTYTALKLPPELLDDILDFLIAHSEYIPGPKYLSFPRWKHIMDSLNREQIRRSTLATCALVCIDWANRCRPQLFFRLSLRNPRDIHVLLEFPTCTTPSEIHTHQPLHQATVC
ncbi:hypothetical protein BC835DRAFT_526997 [Cytidiella melzeri]|nr:hypothetical protein BC835DRAFT_526997 [Cytidiella melzeri]